MERGGTEQVVHENVGGVRFRLDSSDEETDLWPSDWSVGSDDVFWGGRRNE